MKMLNITLAAIGLISGLMVAHSLRHNSPVPKLVSTLWPAISATAIFSLFAVAGMALFFLVSKNR